MFFVAPDDNLKDEGASPAEPELAPSGLAPPDTVKVELDLEDAPFLEKEPEPAPPPVPEDTASEALPAEPPAQQEASGLRGKILSRLHPLLERLSANKKKLLIAGGGALVLIAAAILVNIFLFADAKKPAASPEAASPNATAAPGVTRIVVPSSPAANASIAPGPYPHLFELEPFLVEKRGTEGEVRFLTCRVVLATDKEILNAEFAARLIILRDAIYYYLKNKPVTLLDSETKANALRADLISVVNEHLSSGKVTDLYIKDYLVTTP